MPHLTFSHASKEQAKAQGVETEVIDLEVAGGRCTGVLTDRGRIQAEQVLLATNVWASVLPAKVGLRFPILGVEHQYVMEHTYVV